jgi:hypothetical protein
VVDLLAEVVVVHLLRGSENGGIAPHAVPADQAVVGRRTWNTSEKHLRIRRDPDERP